MFVLRYIFIATVILLALHQVSGQSDLAYVDFEDDIDYPAKNVELLINIKGDSISAYAFIAKGKDAKETIILAHGYPGHDNNFDIAQAIRRTGKNVISFNYRGAWGNQGEYLYSNSIEDISHLIAYFSSSNQATELRVDTTSFTIIGRSYGAGVALIAGAQHPQVQKIIAISTTNYGEIMESYNDLSELSGFKRYMAKQIMIRHDIDKFLQEMLDQKQSFNIVSYRDQLAAKKVLLIEDSDKSMKWINQLENVQLEKISSNHGFIDKRIELTNKVIDWLYQH